MAQWLERGALPMSLFVVRSRTPLGAGFSGTYNENVKSDDRSSDLISDDEPAPSHVLEKLESL